MDLRSIVDTSELRRQRYLRMAREVGLRPGDRVIELGCGIGHRSIADWNHENEIVGIDLVDPSRVAAAQPNFVYRRCDATDLSIFPDRSFDVALSIGMLEHIVPNERIRMAIRETKRVAARYAFVVPHRYAFIEPHYQMPLFPIWPEALKDIVRRHSRRRGSVIWPTAAEWRALFQDPSLRILNHWYGPVMMYRLIVGGSIPANAPRG
jgi:ubiquinone/menaquinone biosynthesis C-methylase UbiE